MEAHLAKLTIGFVGQGWIGKHYADDFEARGFNVVRYGLEPQYVGNKDKMVECDIVLIAVPTPSVPVEAIGEGGRRTTNFDYSIVREAVGLVGAGKIAVIKSTMQPGSTEEVQKQYPDRIIMHAPEFLREANAAYDAAHPERNIIGIPEVSEKYRDAARVVLSILPEAPYEVVCTAREAEHIKYAGNAMLYLRVVFANMLHDIATADGCDWEVVRAALGADPRIGPSHLKIMHESRPGVAPGRGAAGHCFIKDFAALRELFEKRLPQDTKAIAFLRAAEKKNAELMLQSGKDVDLLKGVYGEGIDTL